MSLELVDQKRVLVSCPLVGHGNPSVAEATFNILNSANIPADLALLEKPAKNGGNFHRVLSKSPFARRLYQAVDGPVRSLSMGYMGALSIEEIKERFPDIQYAKWVGIQEHQFGASDFNNFAAQNFPEGVYCPTGDSRPKPSALEDLRRKNIISIVWNQEALDALKKLNVPVRLAEPTLPKGLYVGKNGLTQKSDSIYVKSSGSGMDEKWSKNIRSALDKLGLPYKFYLGSPNRVFVNGGSLDVKEGHMDVARLFYEDLRLSPPRLLLSGPSEMEMVNESYLNPLGVNVAFFIPYRGNHERENLERALRLKTCLGVIDMEKDKDIAGKIKEFYYAQPNIVKADQLGLGSLPLSLVISN